MATIIIWRSNKNKEDDADIIDNKIIANFSTQAKLDPLGHSSRIRRDDGQDGSSTSSGQFSIPSTDIQEIEGWIDEANMMRKSEYNFNDAFFIHSLSSRSKDFPFVSRQQPGDEVVCDEKIDANNRAASLHDLPIGTSGKFSASFNDLNSNWHSTETHSFKESFGKNREKNLKWKALSNKKENNQLKIDNQLLVRKIGNSGLSVEISEMSCWNSNFFIFPWWFRYIITAVLWVYILTTSSLTLVWSNNYGFFTCINWFISVNLSFLLSFFVLEPSKIILFSVIMAICKIVKKPDLVFGDEPVQVILAKDDATNSKLLKTKRYPLNPVTQEVEHPPPPPSIQQIHELKIRARRKFELWMTFLLVGQYFFLLVSIWMLANLSRTPASFKAAENIRNMMNLKYYDKDSLFNKPVPEFYKKIFGISEIREYFYKTLIPAVHPLDDFNEKAVLLKAFDTTYLKDNATILLGTARIRQLRVPALSCLPPDLVRKHLNGCSISYDERGEDRASYSEGWEPVVDGARNGIHPTNDMWSYRTNEDTESDLIAGALGVYQGGGYVAQLGRKYMETKSIINYLTEVNWINELTRAVVIEMTLFSPEENIISQVVILFEIGNAQSGFLSSSVKPLILLRPDEIDDNFNISTWSAVSLLMLLITVSLILIAIGFVKNVVKKASPMLWTKIWFWLDGLVISLGFMVLQAGYDRYSTMLTILETIEEMKLNEFINIQKLVALDDAYACRLSFTLAIVFLRMWNLVTHAEQKFLVVSLMIGQCVQTLIAYVIFVIVFMTAFVWSGYMAFSSRLDEFYTIQNSFKTLFDELLSVSFFQKLAHNERQMGSVFSLLYAFFTFFLIFNLIIAILDQGLTDAKRIAEQKPNLAVIVDATKDMIQKLFPRLQSFDERKTICLIPPPRLQKMKEECIDIISAKIFSANSAKLEEMKDYLDSAVLAGTGFKLVDIRKKVRNRSKEKDIQMEKMREIIIPVLRKRIHADMSETEIGINHQLSLNRLTLSLKRLEYQANRAHLAVGMLQQLRAKKRHEKVDLLTW